MKRFPQCRISFFMLWYQYWDINILSDMLRHGKIKSQRSIYNSHYIITNKIYGYVVNFVVHIFYITKLRGSYDNMITTRTSSRAWHDCGTRDTGHGTRARWIPEWFEDYRYDEGLQHGRLPNGLTTDLKYGIYKYLSTWNYIQHIEHKYR